MPNFAATSLRDGYHLRVVPIARLADLRADIEAFSATQELNGFQQWIVSRYYYEAPPLAFEARSVIIAAIRSHSYGELYFQQNGRDYCVYAPSPRDKSCDVEAYIRAEVGRKGYHLSSINEFDGCFPIKRFAVQSGLAVYGKNNITYVTGLGSYVGYTVFFTDMEPDTDEWRASVTVEACDGCTLCLEHCPCGAIRPDRFLIDNIYCLSSTNEGPGEEFEPFIPTSIHHTTIDCLRCQYSCPMNAKTNKNTAPPIYFDEAETALLLGSEPFANLPEALQKKCEPVGLGGIPSLKRNLRACFAIVDNGGECSLV